MLVVLIFKRPVGAAIMLAAFMLVFYIPLSYYTDGFFYRRRSRQIEQQRIAASRKNKQTGATDKADKPDGKDG